MALIVAAVFSWIEGSASSQTQPAAFRPAEGQRAWRFPQDHGQHPEYRLEWWYYTGVLTAESGERFGFQVTFFRQGLLAEAPERPSAWAAQSLYAAQAALTLPEQKRFLHEGRAGRDSLGMAGAEAERLGVWVGSWRAESMAGHPHGARIAIPGEGFQLQLALTSSSEPVLNGEQGLDRKGSAAGAASWYYSLPWLAAEGTVTAEGKTWRVKGRAWMDHEFGSSQLDERQVGWDWFGLRLDDGSALMLYRLRRKDGSADPASGGTYMAPDGSAERVTVGAENGPRLVPERVWKSPGSGAGYPVAWRIEWPARNLRLRVEPWLDGQELMPTVGIPFPYWEGAVTVSGERDGRTLAGEGYLELTGYGGEPGRILR